MTIKLALDAGHSASTFKSTGGKGVRYDGGNIFEEHTFNAAVAGYAQQLAEYNGIEVTQLQPLNSDTEVYLDQRVSVSRGFGADLLISIHADASSDPNARGHWSFFWTGHEPSGRLALIWDKHADQLLNATPDRNTRESVPGTWTEFHMCREPVKYGIPSILIEHAFMTNRNDLGLLLSDEFRKDCAKVIVKAVCEYFKLPYKEMEVEGSVSKLDQGVAQTLINTYLKPSWKVADEQEQAATSVQTADAWRTQKIYYKWLADNLRDASGLPRE